MSWSNTTQLGHHLFSIARFHHHFTNDLPTAIERIGSTSVPGAAAEPIIDIDVVLP